MVGCCGCLQLTAQVSIEEHWSGYDYPRELAEGVRYHIIIDGDTLWDLAGRYFSDPLLWPQLYQANDYIKDPDLIYPGDPLILDIGVVVTDDAITDSVVTSDPSAAPGGDDGFSELDAFGEAGEGSAEMDELGEPVAGQQEDVGSVSDVVDFDLESSEFVILPAGNRNDMECSTYIYPLRTPGETIEPDAPRVFGGEVGELDNYAEGDVVYLNKGSDDGLEPGLVFSARRRLENVYSGNNKRKQFLGSAVDQTGKVKIVAVQPENATGLIIDSCFEISTGDFLVPYEQEPIPLITELPDINRFQRFDKEGHGYLVAAEDDLASFGKGHIANIDLGTLTANIAPGDLFIVYRLNPNSNPKKDLSLPDIYLGHAVALKTQERTTTIKIIHSMREMRVGDRVVPYTQPEYNP
jgi:hypothetical protein